MADGVTPVLGLIKPEVGASTDTWGPKYHSAMDKIDSLFTDATKEMLLLAHGGTGADTAAGARTNLGLGSLAVLSSINTAQLEDNSVTAAKIAAGAVTAAKLDANAVFPAGTKMLFQQTSAPTGWTKDTTHNDKALRVVSGAVGSGGSLGFSAAFANRSYSGTTGTTAAGGTVASHTLDINQIPSHTHIDPYTNDGGGGPYGEVQGPQTYDMSMASGGGSTLHSYVSYAGGSGGHSHGFTGASHSHSFSGNLDMAVAYVDLIIATKN